VEQAFRASEERRDQLRREAADNSQAAQLEHARTEHSLKILTQLAQREQRLREEQTGLTPPDSGELERLHAEQAELDSENRDKRRLLEDAETRIPQLEQALREQSSAVDAVAQQVTAVAARIAALQQVQDRIARSEKNARLARVAPPR
jgi:chromosome segregation protein